MKKRLRKKLHRLYLSDIVYTVSVSPVWRKKLYKSPLFEKHSINKFNLEDFAAPLKTKIRDYHLNYSVCVVPWEDTKGWEDWDDTQIYFKFISEEFFSLKEFSANNPDVI